MEAKDITEFNEDNDGQVLLFDTAEEFPVAKINGEMLIVKETSLARAALDLTHSEHRLVSVIASLISPTDLPGKKYYFSLKDYCNFFGLDEDGNHTHMRKTFKTLRSRSFEINRKDEIHITGWINNARLIKKSGIVEIDIDPNILPFLLHIQEQLDIPRIGIDTSIGFIKYPAENIRTFSTSYAFNLYDFFKTVLRDQRQVSYYMTINELRKVMAIKPTEYEHYGMFKRRALLPAIADITGNQKLFDTLGRKTNPRINVVATDINIAFPLTEKKGKGNKIDGITFYVTKLDTIPHLQRKTPEPPQNDEKAKALLELMSIGLTKTMSGRLIKEHSPEHILANIIYAKREFIESQTTRNPIKKLPGFVKYCIENNMAQPNAYELQQQREKTEKEKRNKARKEIEDATAQAAASEEDNAIQTYLDSLNKDQVKSLLEEAKDYYVLKDNKTMAALLNIESIENSPVARHLFRNYVGQLIAQENVGA